VADRFTAIVCDRAEVAGLTVSDELRDSLAAYLLLLSRWTRKINLTSFDLETPTDAAIDRLVIEPLVAAKLVLPTDRFSIDIGSGGGSPAIPMRLAQPNLETVLVEVRERKAAFLREVTRTLRLGNVRVEAQTFEMSRAEVIVVIDGGIAGQRLLSRVPGLAEQRGPDGLLQIDAIAEAYWMLHHQHRSAWTLELDLRPWSESF